MIYTLNLVSEHSFSQFLMDTDIRVLFSPTSLQHETENTCRQVDMVLIPMLQLSPTLG